MIVRRLKLLLMVLVTTILVCTVLAYAVVAQPVQASSGEPVVESTIDLRIQLPDFWPWNLNGQGAWTLRLWQDAGS